jgi:hypothetical protein
LTANQAALASVNQFSAGVYSERRFLLQQLSQYQLSIARPTSVGHVGLRADYMGDAAFNESQVGVAYARKLAEKLDVGVQFNYYNLKTAAYGSAASLNVEGGFMNHLSDQMNLGVHVYNPTSSKIGEEGEEKLPVIISFGAGYDISRKFFLAVELQKVEDAPLNVNAGMQYSFDKKLFASAGIASANNVYYLGFGVEIKNVQVTAVASMHPYLGVTPGLSLLYNAAPHD